MLESEFDGVVAVLEPVCVTAVPVDGVELLDEPPALALDELPVDADAEDPPDPEEFADVELFVEVVALADPPWVAVGVGVGVGDGDGVGVCVAVGVGVCVCGGAGWPVVPIEVGAGVGVGVAVAVVVEVDVVVVDVVEEPPIAGLTLMIGWTVIVGE